MSVCDVPLCPNLGMDGPQLSIGASKGVPRVSRNNNETRDRLRIRLHQRKENLRSTKNTTKFAFNPDATYDRSSIKVKSKVWTAHVPEEDNEILEKESNPKILSLTNKQTLDKPKIIDKPIINMVKKSGIDANISKTTKSHNSKLLQCLEAEELFDIKLGTDYGEKENEPMMNGDCRLTEGRCGSGNEDIDELIKFIEGNKHSEKIESVQKKAAKKARQKEKKENERRKKFEEEEAIRKAEAARIREEKRKEEERLRAEMLAKQAAAKKLAKKQKNQQHNQKPVNPSTNQEITKNKKNSKKNKKNNNDPNSEVQFEKEMLEQTIPAMVTIKRITENNNSPPTVTITLKGSTPDQDKLLYTLVNGHNDPENKNDAKPLKNTTKKENIKINKKKNKNLILNEQAETVTTKQLKITLSVDKSFRKQIETTNNIKEEVKQKIKQKTKEEPNKNQQNNKSQNKTRKLIEPNQEKKVTNNIIDIPSLKLPPGITITKVNGPLTNRKSNVQSSEYQNEMPVNKSGVIVVDTEKLIQQSSGTKKNKKKKKKQQQQQQQQQQHQQQEQQTKKEPVTKKTPPMVTLKNPIFAKLQTKINKPEPIPQAMMNINEQATISKGVNGMVTIRRPRTMPMENETAMPMTGFLKPVIQANESPTHSFSSVLSADRKIIRPPPKQHNANNELAKNLLDSSRLNPQTILWGLPGIQITRVNKQNEESKEHQKELDKEQTADVSIIRSRPVNGNFNLERDDWPYENVFAPKDILEDDLDADERELEAFKRFCQQSVPPKHKEKVAHLNVKDIVLMKKNDANRDILLN